MVKQSNAVLTYTALFIISILIFGGLNFQSDQNIAGAAIGLETQLQPNIKALTPKNIDIWYYQGKKLRFSASSWNNGKGPLHLVAGEVIEGRQKVYQLVYNSDGSFTEYIAGDFIWHAGHNHFHFEDFALYTLQPIAAPGASARTSSKTTFCVMDTTRVNTKLPGAPRSAVYSQCSKVVQGMSVGWGDTYSSSIAGQWIDITGMPDGDYLLSLEFDPKNKLLEIDEADNIESVKIRIRGDRVQVLR